MEGVNRRNGVGEFTREEKREGRKAEVETGEIRKFSQHRVIFSQKKNKKKE